MYPAEADMAKPDTRFPSLKSIAGVALAGLGIFVLSGKLDWAVSQVRNLVCGTARDGLGVLLCIALAAWQAMPAYGFDPHRLLLCLLQMLQCFWLLVASGAI